MYVQIVGAARCCRWLLALSLLSGGLPALALRDIAAGELALTPAFCQDVQSINGWSKDKGGRSPRAEHWLSLMGETFWAMHHYCWGLIQMNRARAAGVEPQIRAGLRRQAIDDYEFVLKYAPPGYVMLPEIYWRIGESYDALDQRPVALLWYEKSRASKPDYWPAYFSAAESLLILGRKDEARRMVEEGLRQVPGNSPLMRMGERLGGVKVGAASAPRS